MKKRVVLLMIIGLATQIGVWQPAYAESEVSEAQVYSEAELLYREIERVRLYAGVRAPRSREFRMENAQPRHVYFQTQIAFRRCNLLAQQMTGISRAAAPVAPEGDPSLTDTLAIIKAARGQLDVVEQTLEATAPLPEAPKIRKRDISSAMVRVVEANLLLHELTGYVAEWSDIWDRLFQIMTYVGGALPAENRYPALEEHVPGKSIADIAAHMLAIRAAAAPAFEAVGVSEVRTKIIKPAEGGSSAEGIADLAATFINDFAEVTYRLGAEEVDPPSYQRPNRVFASHVYQLATALRKQAELLGEMH
ncbi:MAG: hypothetical protein ACR2PZ_22580 [Pseudomonadales bacterium]